MDRRQARRRTLRTIGEIENRRDYLETISEQVDQQGDPILAGELRRYNDKLTDVLDKMYVWAGNL